MNIGTLDLPLYKTSSYISLNEIPKERVLYEENFYELCKSGRVHDNPSCICALNQISHDKYSECHLQLTNL